MLILAVPSKHSPLILPETVDFFRIAVDGRYQSLAPCFDRQRTRTEGISQTEQAVSGDRHRQRLAAILHDEVREVRRVRTSHRNAPPARRRPPD